MIKYLLSKMNKLFISIIISTMKISDKAQCLLVMDSGSVDFMNTLVNSGLTEHGYQYEDSNNQFLVFTNLGVYGISVITVEEYYDYYIHYTSPHVTIDFRRFHRWMS